MQESLELKIKQSHLLIDTADALLETAQACHVMTQLMINNMENGTVIFPESYDFLAQQIAKAHEALADLMEAEVVPYEAVDSYLMRGEYDASEQEEN